MSVHGRRYFENPYRDQDSSTLAQETIKTRVIKIVDLIRTNYKPTKEKGDGGLYVGTAGIAYMFYYLAKSGNFPSQQNAFLQQAETYIASALKHYERHISERKRAAYLTGCGGVYAVAAVIYNKLDKLQRSEQYVAKYQSLATVCEDINFLENGSDELFVGRAGYLMGAILLKRELKREVISSQQMIKLCQIIMESGKRFRHRMHASFDADIPVMYAYHGTLYLGAAHGISGIFQTLLSVPSFIESDKANVALIYKSMDFLLKNCVQHGNMASNLEGALVTSSRRKMLVHWCHGAAGVIYMYARAYLVSGKKESYLQVCCHMAEVVWEQGLLYKGPGICHGVSGSGFVHLLMYRLTGDDKYFQRAKKFSDFMFTDQFYHGARTPDCPYSLFEGWAGAACFLNDLLNPSSSEFPLMDVFL